MEDIYNIDGYLNSFNSQSFNAVANYLNENKTKNDFYPGNILYEWAKDSVKSLNNLTEINDEQKKIAVNFINDISTIGNNIIKLYRVLSQYNLNNRNGVINQINIIKHEIENNVERFVLYKNQIKQMESSKDSDLAYNLYRRCITILDELIYNLKNTYTINIDNSPLKNIFKLAYSVINEAYDTENAKLFHEIRKTKIITVTETNNPHSNIFSNNGFILFEKILNEYVKSIGTRGRLSEIAFYYWSMYNDINKYIHQRPEVFKSWFYDTYNREDLGKIKTLNAVKNIDRTRNYSLALDWFKTQTE